MQNQIHNLSNQPNTKIKEIFNFGLDFIYPDDIKCIICDEELKECNRYGICQQCKLPKNSKFCTVCGNGIVDISPVCDQCKGLTHEYKIARGALLYKDEVQKLIRRYKFGSAKYLARYLAEFALDTYFENSLNCDILTFVPLHKSKLKLRGYNQAKVLALEIGQQLDKPVIDTMSKIKQLKDTARLSREQRLLAVKDTFAINEQIKEQIIQKNILLVDDVYTTGATANECSRILKQAGAKSINVLTIATGIARKPRLA